MESKYDILRKKLDDFGYTQTLKPECIPLVEKLLDDLTTTTENLQKYMKLAQQALEERDNLELGVEPYKCDNAKLIKECNELHLAFIQFKEQHERNQRDLRTQIGLLENKLEDNNIEKTKLKEQLKELQAKFAKKNPLLCDKKSIDRENKISFRLKTDMAAADEKMANLHRELMSLKESYTRLSKEHEFCQHKISNRDKEIKRLTDLLEGGRPTSAVKKDCCYKNVNNKLGGLQDELNSVKKENNLLQSQLKDALAKQHEAMRRALHLAERNKQLEKEMKDMDQIALAVEAECNNRVKTNAEKITRLQDRMNESIIIIQNLERDNASLKHLQKELTADLESVKLEKKHLKAQLECESEERKRLTDKINRLNVIENDLNMEIDRLTKITTEQKRRIAELESQLSTAKPRSVTDYPGKEKKAGIGSNGKTKTQSPILMETCDNKCCCEAGSCIKSLKELLDREIDYRQKQSYETIESLKQEKEFYLKEYHKLLDEKKAAPLSDRPEYKQCGELLQKLTEKDKSIERLQKEIHLLTQEKYSLARKASDQSMEGVCDKPLCKRKEREIELLRDNLKHAEQERETLLRKIQSINETTVFNEERMKKAFQEMEEHITKLEDERKSLVKGQVTNRSNITQLEEECNALREQLKQTQNELNLHKANYNQLKMLHEQTDRALLDAQNQLIKAEGELSNLKGTINKSSKEASSQDLEIQRLNNDIKIMKGQLSKLDKEKDELLNIVDDKTEKIALLEDQLKSRTDTISSLESELKELRRKISKYEDSSTARDSELRSTRHELASLQRECDRERKLKESAIQENRRLHDDLASVTRDCKEARNELEICRRQVEDLTTQVQTYVAEIKRIEDLLTQKEMERGELLDQFKSLSQEANVLESNNNTLENEATQSRVQLSVALDHTSDLERRIASHEATIRSYERQISELTSQVASLEMQLKQKEMQQESVDSELKQMRELCLKLDHEKDNLRHEAYTKDDKKIQVERNIERLSKEKKSLEEELQKYKDNIEHVEKLLSEARQEALEQRLLNQDLQEEITRLKAKVNQLQERLHTTSDQLDMYKEKALDYSQQNKQLRRQIANERFARSRDDEKRYPSL